MKRRIVVTGMGTISPLGNDLPITWEAVLAGRGGVGPITRFDNTDSAPPSRPRSRFDPKPISPPKEVRRMDTFVQYAQVAAREAVADAGLTFDDE
jgi:3-oxoacyl-(acyl-carrier-protein) synthase